MEMNPYQFRVELAESDIRSDLESVLDVEDDIRTQLYAPLQDDWDDAINVAATHVRLATIQLREALHILKTY
jgi:hypothetical protein